ncbi:hypothetical protein SAMN05216223_110209 [Actinacidiphila yanglinensis]|uniref:Uncharacterized protein n=1 Tax=Actinacidiphila yanglinensis TaxID=310779 RepID=A0A1H6CY67_9ACTN|nr:DUF6227 family protein [Actinacidiphila yanglinensis]SEG77336.1 hypothetical protein SAMN05216223_110209 [Actinacidiphila yanglinensis]
MDAEPARAVEPDIERAGGRPAEQLARLLGRAENGAHAARHLAEVRSALMHYCGLQSCRHAKGPPRPMDRRTFRHSFLLPDGGVRLVWELEHNTGPGGVPARGVFTDPGELALAEWEVDAAFGRPLGPRFGPDDMTGITDITEAADLAEIADLTDFGGLGALDGADGSGGPRGASPSEPPLPLPSEQAGCHRAYTEGGSPEHARRLLRRASNTNPPSEDVHQRLRAAIAHTIGIVTRRNALVAGRTVTWTLYEHAFLLLDGTELSLWEIDHTGTPSGNPVCEVYASRDAALDTAVRRIEAG